MQILVEHHVSNDKLETLGVRQWPTWQKEISTFDWTFHEKEQAFILEGECEVTPLGGSPVKFAKGDFVVFPAGLKVSWSVIQPLHKHYRLDGNLFTQSLKRIKAAIGL